ncbi:growth hormone-inducible transmembrane protein-like isoform X2 [Symsagittifera roscoffensis]
MKATQVSSDLGKLAVLGTCATGLGALCVYGVLQPTSDSVLDQSVAYPAYVRERIRSTYLAFGSGLAMTAATAVTCARRPQKLMPLLSRMSTPMGAIGAMAVCFGSGIAVQVTPTPEKGHLGLKHAVWCMHSALLGGLIFPAIAIYGPLVGQAALYTGGALAGLSAIAITAPSEKFLVGGGMLGMGFAALFAANIGTMFAPSIAQPFMVNVITYGGVVLFSGFILHYTQGLVHRAKAIPPDANMPGARPNFDPINNAIGLYTHTLNLFMHILRMLALNQRKK